MRNLKHRVNNNFTNRCVKWSFQSNWRYLTYEWFVASKCVHVRQSGWKDFIHYASITESITYSPLSHITLRQCLWNRSSRTIRVERPFNCGNQTPNLINARIMRSESATKLSWLLFVILSQAITVTCQNETIPTTSSEGRLQMHSISKSACKF